ncbi:carboxylating nicotinate-nucleotide diphosphorylase [Ruania suaedae]|uniref:carboxylating nicotinate-nucleotide diphosphorylase n=1 Tax=Ruania suaedae TaxID=2897774 RepID=UPI001E59F47E|nr:carboxylating nicotinate-nucleotide diphosphorylase [Ruania suaedae]UFU03815.1 carboxylating nicotinate-nucleotide diphosphorylase [Ruania suaedae]
MTWLPALDPAHVSELVRAALAEDAPWGDLTGGAFVPPSAIARAQLTARIDGTLAGADVATEAFAQAGATLTWHTHDGARFRAGEVLAETSGPARAVLRAERVALNFLQRLCGTATLTAAFVDAVAGTGVRIADTRKTTPGLRALEKHAVLAGGGSNHRFSLSDAVMVKDNHLAVAREAGLGVTEAIRAAKQRLGHTVHVEVEVDRLEQIEPVLAAGVDTIMLDNFSLADLRTGVELVAGRAIVEASGTVRLETVRAIAGTGVDVISVGALTHSAPALDLGLDVHVAGGV